MEKIEREVRSAMDTMISGLSEIEESAFNEVPFEGSWTAGQLSQHVLLSNAGFAQLLNGAVEESQRPVDEQVENFKNLFLNFDLKMESPEFIRPQLKDYNQSEQIESLREIERQLVRASLELDLSKTCTSFKLPGSGYLTRLEAIYFVIYHTGRHNHQLKKIRQALIKN